MRMEYRLSDLARKRSFRLGESNFGEMLGTDGTLEGESMMQLQESNLR